MTVIRHYSELGRWESTYREPHPALRRHVAGPYQGWTEQVAEPVRRREVPGAFVPLILNLGSPWVVVDRERGGRLLHLDSFTAGLYTSYAVVQGTGPSRCIQVNLTPIGALLVLDRPLGDLTNRSVALDDLLGKAGTGLVEQLRDAASWEECFDLVDLFLAGRIQRARPPATAVTWAWRLLTRGGGSVTVGELATEIGYSRKHLTAQIREQLGLPPKVLARVIRFNRAIRAAGEGNEVRWASVAQDCGYFDQAHFIRDFVAFSGMTPGEFERRRIADGGLRD